MVPYVSLMVALTVHPAKGGKPREILVHLPDLPEPGEVIELPDGTRTMVDQVAPSTHAGIDVEVSATRYA
jgi:hypothetical protein